MQIASIDYIFSKIIDPIKQALKFQRISSLAHAANATKNVPAGHRLYLRSVTLMELELGIKNEHNAEVKEGILTSVQELVTQKKPVVKEEEVSDPLKPGFKFKAQANQILAEDEEEDDE